MPSHTNTYSVTGTVGDCFDDLQFNNLDNRNLYASANNTFGRDNKNTDWYTAYKFQNTNIPKGCTISDAHLTLEAYSTQSGACTIPIKILNKDGKWDTAAASRWERVEFSQFSYRVYAGITQKEANFVGGSDRLNLLCPTTGFSTYSSLGQIITASSSYTATEVDFYGARVGTISGTNNVWAEIWSVTNNHPDTLLATSTAKNASSISTTDGWIQFTGISQALTSGTKYALVFCGTYTPSASNYISLDVNNTSITNGLAIWYGTGQGFNDINYACISNVLEEATFAGSAVNWTPASWTANSSYNTDNFASILQTYIDSASYTPGDPLGIWLDTGTNAQNCYRDAHSKDSSGHAAPQLSVTYTPKGIQVTGSTIRITGSTIRVK